MYAALSGRNEHFGSKEKQKDTCKCEDKGEPTREDNDEAEDSFNA